MSKHFQKVLKALKTSDDVKALGFDRDEIKRLASDIDKKLSLSDDASDEDVENAIDEAVENALPYLKMAQSTVSRIVKKKLAKSKKDEEGDDDDDDDDDEGGGSDDDDDDEDEDPKGKVTKKSKKQKKSRISKSDDDDDEVKSLLKSVLKKIEKQEETIASLRKGSVVDKRRAKLEKILKDTGTFGKRYLRRFEKMEFDDDDDFEEFLDEVMDDLEETNQERANAGLDKLGIKTAPEGKHGDQEDENQEVASDEEVDKLADLL